MKKAYITIVFLILIALITVFIFRGTSPKEEVTVLTYEESMPETEEIETEIVEEKTEEEGEYEPEALYHQMELDSIINYDAFRLGIKGFNRIKSRQKDILALIDFSKPATEQRLFIFDLKKKEILFKTYVSHGMNSGDKYATSFSNAHGSYKSSLGFFLTAEAYEGLNGYSLFMDGLEPGINDQVRERYIVFHGASYTSPASPDYHKRMGWGRSLGCPAVPEEHIETVIDILKDGSVVYIFADDPEYFDQSNILS